MRNADEERKPPTSMPMHRRNLAWPTTPTLVVIDDLNHPHLRLRQPLAVRLTREDSCVFARIPGSDIFGYGVHWSAAVADLIQALVELYDVLDAEQDRLGPAMIRVWKQLQATIEEGGSCTQASELCDPGAAAPDHSGACSVQRGTDLPTRAGQS